MKTSERRTQIFLVLVPHRDIRVVLRKYSAALFSAGFSGAYHFPWTAPLAVLSRPFSTDELKNFAGVLREAAGGNKFFADQTAAVNLTEEISLFGHRLCMEIPRGGFTENAAAKTTKLFSPPVIGSCLLFGDETGNIPSPPQLSFRAAAVANMYFRSFQKSDGAFGCKWRIGKLIWLPNISI